VYTVLGHFKLCRDYSFYFLGEYNMCWEICNGVGFIRFISGRVYSMLGHFKCVGIIRFISGRVQYVLGNL
jgi:hypothetical protein